MSYDPDYAAEYRRRKRDEMRAYRIAYRKRPDVRERLNARKRKKQKLTPAWAMIKNRVQKGSLKRGNCVFCGAPNAHGHHEDYRKPLEIVWVCQAHHSAIHTGKLQVKPEHITVVPNRASYGALSHNRKLERNNVATT